MPIIRNPFRKQDEHARPTSGVVETTNNNNRSPPKSIDLGEKQSTEYKLSGRLPRESASHTHVN